jgi:hypothetical protein
VGQRERRRLDGAPHRLSDSRCAAVARAAGGRYQEDNE